VAPWQPGGGGSLAASRKYQLVGWARRESRTGPRSQCRQGEPSCPAMSLETRSNSALIKRAEQLKRWQDSETFREAGEPRSKNRRIGFSDGCVFLAACAAGDREEVRLLLGRGADIDTANVDGLTALHQACIDDNLDMVEFLVANGADVDRGDNEGWTPLHATASCGFLSIARFLLDHGSNVAAVNNDGELAIDISESDEMEELLQKEIDAQKVNCEEARNREEQCMLDDARDWKNSGKLGDKPHHKTGATALHVAAAKGYTKVMALLIGAGCEVNQQDYDGWTPLHAAAHWAQREACVLLTDAYVNMDIKNCVGQTPFDVADPDVLRLLEDLKKKQNNCSKDRPDIRALITRPPTTSLANKGGRSSWTSSNSGHGDVIRPPTSSNHTAGDRSSITRLSQQEKVHSTKEITAKETIKEEKDQAGREVSESDRDSTTDTESESSLSERLADPALPNLPLDAECRGGRGLDSPGVVVTDEQGKEAQPTFLPPHPEAGQAGKDDGSAPWRRPGSLRARPAASGLSGKLSPSSEDLVTVRRAHSFGSDEKFYAKLDELRKRIRANSMPVLNREEGEARLTASLPRPVRKTSLDNAPTSTPSIAPYSAPPAHTASLPRPPRPSARLPAVAEQERPPLPPKPSPAPPPPYAATAPPPPYNSYIIAPQPYRRAGEGEEATNPDPWRHVSEDVTKQSPDLRPRSQENLAVSRAGGASTPTTQAQVRRSFVPPVRDEEHEIQRKAHAKRVRETRRSTQGVTLEDLKSAEQLVKKKQQQENATRTTELQQLAAGPPSPPQATPIPGGILTHPAPAATTVTTSATLNLQVGTGGAGGRTSSSSEEQERQERRPSWRLRIESGDNKSRFTLEDTVKEGEVVTSPQPTTRLSLGPSHTHAPLGAPSHTHAPLGAPSHPHAPLAPPSHPSPTEQRRISRLEAAREAHRGAHHQGESDGAPGSPTVGLCAVQRKKKPKRRSTGVLSAEDLAQRSDESAEENGSSPPTAHESSPLKSNLKTNGGGQVDYKKLWEDSQAENSRLRAEMESTRGDLDSTRQQLDSAIQVLAKNSVSDIEKREKKVLEKKLGEMEDELKTLDQLKADNQRLRDENGALIRVISKLSK